jgi:hypothetical protein
MARGIKIDQGSSNTKYVKVSADGKFEEIIEKALTSDEHAQRWDVEKKPDMSFRVIKKGIHEGKIRWTRKIREFEGQLVDIRFDDSGAYGDQYKMRFDVSEPGKPQFINFDFDVDSDIANSIVLKMPNVKDFKNDLRMFAYALDIEGSEYKRLGVALYEMNTDDDKGTKVLPFYTKDKPGGMPKWKKVKVNGKQVMDKTDALDFIKNMMLNEVLPKVKTVAPEQPVDAITQNGEAKPTEFENTSVDAEELPF